MRYDTAFVQSTVGTVVKSGDHGEPIGVFSALNTQRYRDLQCLKEIKTYLSKNCKSQSTQAALDKASSLIRVSEQAFCARAGVVHCECACICSSEYALFACHNHGKAPSIARL